MRIIFWHVLFFCLLSGFCSHGQGGAQITAGLVAAQNAHPAISVDGMIHSGFSIGIQSRLKDGVFVAGPGFRYTRFTMASADFFNVTKKENYHFISVPFNIGLQYQLNKVLKCRVYVGPDATFFYRIDENSGTVASKAYGVSIIDYDFVKDYFWGVHAGCGLDIFWLTLDFSVEKGLTDAHAFENSSYNIINATLGFFF